MANDGVHTIYKPENLVVCGRDLLKTICSLKERRQRKKIRSKDLERRKPIHLNFKKIGNYDLQETSIEIPYGTAKTTLANYTAFEKIQTLQLMRK